MATKASHGVSEPVVWLDGLDIPMVRFFDAGFAENDDAKVQQVVRRPEGHSLARFGHNMVPVRHDHVAHLAHLQLSLCPQPRGAGALQKQEAPDAWLGHKLRYINPLTGGAPMPTIATNLQLLPKGFAGKAHRAPTARSTAWSKAAARRDRGQRFAFAPRDTFVVPRGRR
jgi:gentisate 1,2-dioxygenase